MNETNILWAAIWWLTLNRYKIIKERYWNLQKAWDEINEDFLKQIWENKERIEIFLEKKSKVNLSLQKSLLEKHQANIIFFEDKNYPENLKNISDPPIFLYCQWEILPQDNISLAVVWSRKITYYGRQTCIKIVSDLASKLTIISWFAQWIDAKAHEAAIDYWWRTIAVLWHWLDMIYPISNRWLAKRILDEKKWAIISELPFWILPEKFNFPRRNRIIAWMSLWTLVVEARENSGSLITADLAVNYNKEVFAIPWNIYSFESVWTNSLIKNWEAKLVTCAEDIFAELNLNNKVKSEQIKLEFDWDNEENLILSVLDYVWKDFSQISFSTWFSQPVISSKMMMLELKWQVMDLGMGIWVRK